MHFLKAIVNTIEQVSLINNIENDWVQKTVNKNVFEIIKMLIQVLNCKIQKYDFKEK